MIKRIVILCFSFVFLVHFSARADEYDFRKTHWGMSTEEVQINELSKIIKIEDNQLIYEIEMFGKKCILRYGFEKNKLISGVYMFVNVSKKEKNIIYHNIVNALKDKYKDVNNDNPFKENISIFENKNTHITVINTKELGLLYEEKKYQEKQKLLRENKLKKEYDNYKNDLDNL